MLLDKETEKLFIRFLNPLEILLPSEIHELSRALLDAYRKQAQEKSGDISFHYFIREILDRYYPYIEKLVIKRGISITERMNIFKWWKQIFAVPSIQSLLINTPYPMAAPVLKICLVTAYLVKSKWHKRTLRKLILSLDQEIGEGGDLKTFHIRYPNTKSTCYKKMLPVQKVKSMSLQQCLLMPAKRYTGVLKKKTGDIVGSKTNISLLHQINYIK